MSLISRHLEANGIPTVMIGNARDIVEACGVARFLFTDFPLGSPCGEPFNADMQRRIVSMAFDLLESATDSRTTRVAPFEWSKGDTWKDKVLTKEQPWKDGKAQDDWLEKKELYRKLRAAGKV